MFGIPAITCSFAQYLARNWGSEIDDTLYNYYGFIFPIAPPSIEIDYG